MRCASDARSAPSRRRYRRLADTDVPFAVVAPYVAQLKANGEPVDVHTYPTDHNGTMAASLPDSIPFVRAQLR